MQTILIVILTMYFTIDFMGNMISWANSKTRKEYIWNFANTLFSIAIIFIFISVMRG